DRDAGLHAGHQGHAHDPLGRRGCPSWRDARRSGHLRPSLLRRAPPPSSTPKTTMPSLRARGRSLL
ncbi:MAG: Threonine dehydratase, catabolic @ L-serine dehydratase, (PLP)-dependent, partial [uncultured Rubellimicrobium sp.]